MSAPNPNAISSISVLAAAGARPVTVFGPEDDEDEHGLYQERTPLNSANNSPEGRKSVAARSGKAPLAGGVDAKSQITAKRAQHEMHLARHEAQAYAEEKLVKEHILLRADAERVADRDHVRRDAQSSSPASAAAARGG